MVDIFFLLFSFPKCIFLFSLIFFFNSAQYFWVFPTKKDTGRCTRLDIITAFFKLRYNKEKGSFLLLNPKTYYLMKSGLFPISYVRSQWMWKLEKHLAGFQIAAFLITGVPVRYLRFRLRKGVEVFITRIFFDLRVVCETRATRQCRVLIVLIRRAVCSSCWQHLANTTSVDNRNNSTEIAEYVCISRKRYLAFRCFFSSKSLVVDVCKN